MEFSQLKIHILVNVSCKFEMYIFKIAQVISENIRIAFLYVLSIDEYGFNIMSFVFLKLIQLSRAIYIG